MKCEYCGKEMLTADGCDCSKIKINGKMCDRIKVGAPKDFLEGSVYEGERCHDCGALYGHYHHPGCDSETCPVCGGQMFVCDCNKEALYMPHSKKERFL